jgi:serine/threonine-protein kinase
MTQTMDSPPADSLVGQTVVGKYKIIKLLGEGGMGSVYLAEQAMGTAHKKVALKTLHKHLSHDPSIKKRFDLEIANLCSLEHPNTIQVTDGGTMEDGTLYLVMEYVQGKSVAEVLEKEGPMQPGRVDNIFRQVCGSLSEAHGKGLIHRDLKPDNVLLCERAGTHDWVEVLDFGIAKRSSEHDPNEAKLTQQGMVLGTPPYMSPEQFTGQPIDLRSDIYALGVMAYEMLTGKFPFEANTAWEWASKHMTEPPRPIELQQLGAHVPDKMRRAIMRALAKTREERQASVDEFFKEFSAGAAGGTAVIAPMGGEMPPMSGPSQRGKTEMGAPAMTPAPMTPAQMMGGGPAPAAMGGGGAAVPAAPAPAPAKSGGGMGLILGLGALAVVLLGGGAIAYVATRPKKAVIDPSLTTSAGPTVVTETSASAVASTDTPPDVGSTTPLGHTPTPPGPAVHPDHKPSASAKPIPTPTPTPPSKPPADAICAQARNAIKTGNPQAPALADQCRKAGGHL